MPAPRFFRTEIPFASDSLIADLTLSMPPSAIDCALFFVSPDLDLAPFRAELSRAFPNARLLGARSRGRAGNGGPDTPLLRALGLPRSHFRSRVVSLTAAETLSTTTLARKLLATRKSLYREVPGWPQEFAILLLDTDQIREEATASRISSALGTALIIGGGFCASDAADGPSVFGGIENENAAAILIQVRGCCRAAGFRIDNFRPGERRLVVTGADPEARLVTELNGAPAAAEYGRILGLHPFKMTEADFAAHPLLVRIGEDHCIQSICGSTPDGALEFQSPLSVGVVLRDAVALDVPATLDRALAQLSSPVEPAAILAFDSRLRQLDRDRLTQNARLADLLDRHRVIRVRTQGEIQGSLYHSNTLTGLAIYPPVTAEEDAHVPG